MTTLTSISCFRTALLVLAACFLPRAGGQTTKLAYRYLSFDLSTSADWTSVIFAPSAKPLSCTVASTRGNPVTADVGGPAGVNRGTERISVTQSLASAQNLNLAGATFLCAFAADILPLTLPISLQKGSINFSQVAISTVVSGSNMSLGQYERTGAIPADPTGQNSSVFLIDTSILANAQPSSTLIATPPKTLLAFYYPWYTASGWNSGLFIDAPLLGRYDSSDLSILQSHINEAQLAGIDGFISSWWGPNDYTDNNFKSLLQLARGSGFKVSMYLESLDNITGKPRAPDQLEQWLRFFLSTYGSDQSLYRFEGKPVVFIWASNSQTDSTWSTIFANLRRAGLDALFMALSNDPSSLAVFDGLHTYTFGVAAPPVLDPSLTILVTFQRASPLQARNS